MIALGCFDARPFDIHFPEAYIAFIFIVTQGAPELFSLPSPGELEVIKDVLSEYGGARKALVEGSLTPVEDSGRNCNVGNPAVGGELPLAK